jgi:hypothetical protein
LLSRESSDGLCGVGAAILSFLAHIAALSVRLARFAGRSAIPLAIEIGWIGTVGRAFNAKVTGDSWEPVYLFVSDWETSAEWVFDWNITFNFFLSCWLLNSGAVLVLEVDDCE